MDQILYVLLVEDTEEDAYLTLRALHQGGYKVTHALVDTPDAMRAALKHQNWDMILSDHAMPQFSAPQALALAKELRPDIPFIIVSGEIDLNLAVSLMRKGAQDYIQKHDLARLVPAVQRELREVALRRQRKETEEALRESEGRWQFALEGAGDGLWDWNPQTDRVFFSRQWKAMLGFAEFEIENRLEEWDRLLHPQDREQVYADLQRHFDGETPVYQNEHRLLCKDGTYKWVLDRGKVIQWTKDGKPLRVIGTHKDITEQKQADETLRKSEALYHDLVETSQDLIWQCDAEGRYVYLNPAWEQVLGYTIEEMLGRKFSDFQSPEMAARDEKEFARLMQGDSISGLETVHISKSGSNIHLVFNAKLVTDENGKKGGTRGTAYNITERQQMEAALKESEERYRQLFQSMESGFALHEILCDAQGEPNDYRFLSINPAFEKMTGLQAESLIGRTVLEAMPGTEKVWIERYGKVALSGESTHFENYSQELGKYYEVTAYSPRRGQFAVIFHDVTGRKRSEELIHAQAQQLEAQNEELVAQNEELKASDLALQDAEVDTRRLNLELDQRISERTVQLETANAELEAFSYSVSHDLRAPLRRIDGFAAMLGEEYAPRLDIEGTQLIANIHTSVERMNTLIDALLGLAHLSRSDLKREVVDLSALTRHVAADLGQSCPERQVEWVIAEGITADADAHLVRVVLENLLGNALKFTSRRQAARIEFGASLQEDGRLAYFVRDNGAGFDSAYAGRLFGAFQRLHTETEFPGSGIGLATVRRIINRHGGRTWAEGAVEQGAAFYFTL